MASVVDGLYQYTLSPRERGDGMHEVGAAMSHYLPRAGSLPVFPLLPSALPCQPASLPVPYRFFLVGQSAVTLTARQPDSPDQLDQLPDHHCSWQSPTISQPGGTDQAYDGCQDRDREGEQEASWGLGLPCSAPSYYTRGSPEARAALSTRPHLRRDPMPARQSPGCRRLAFTEYIYTVYGVAQQASHKNMISSIKVPTQYNGGAPRWDGPRPMPTPRRTTLSCEPMPRHAIIPFKKMSAV
ncbi:hypothetical protein DHEL01_v207689 [Diaporthe helianthi]|uniref:Uncharacterized protein n=1 Tax=Diaporthe helianthi TaxID=158607 RepID=A0A2P5HUJ5_DIAHE|nr:hypothetical protein DHEL01_v207689 [Diaporthe helianthi]